ncbi:ethyl tert-butyl ether degradation protein EthD [Cupriavidus sp. CuC1]|uniref:ethyl tert-butyl ether degradation protein EthD n=1 Tax=Cupriavidus sp. CuC1 TaxID=3373131 RepID=UPI0037D39846
MTFSYLITATNELDPAVRIDATQVKHLAEAIRLTPDLLRAEIYTPADVETYHRDGAAPLLALRLEFTSLQSLEAQITRNGYLYRFFGSSEWTSMPCTRVTHQAMLTRTFLPLESGEAGEAAPDFCSYLVHYPGEAANLNDWLGYYLRHHPQVMTEYPGVRQINVFTRVDWYDDMPWERVGYMQRNMLTFSSAGEMLEAIDSPVRLKMRQDAGSFPAFSGGAVHYPMFTKSITP